MAAALAQTLRNALAHKALREEKKRLQVLLNVSTVLAANWNVQEAFPTISAYLRRVLRQEYAAFLLLDEKSGMFVRQALDFPLGKGIHAAIKVTYLPMVRRARSLRQRASRTFSREDMQTFHFEFADAMVAEGIRSLCCVPLIRPKAALGALVLGSTRGNAFTADDVVLLTQVAAQLAVAAGEPSRFARDRELEGAAVRGSEVPGGRDSHRAPFRRHRGSEPVIETDAEAGGDGCGQRRHGSDLRRDRNRQRNWWPAPSTASAERKDRSFIKLNCAAIPTGLLESELFGHEKGAFTGAVSRKIGRLELADHGTLFLDEIGEIPGELQPKLLRVLQDQEFERLGGTKTIEVDLRADRGHQSRPVEECLAE